MTLRKIETKVRQFGGSGILLNDSPRLVKIFGATLQPGRSVSLRRVISAALLVTYLSLLLKLTLFLDTGSIPPPDQRLNLVPFKTIVLDLKDGGRAMVVNFLGNLVAFVPLGFLVPLLRESRAGAQGIAVLSIALSLLIETLQYLSGSRVADIDDVVLNTLGGLLGYAAWAVTARWAGRIV
jgi:glycopeptide antibiotics resistance protein